MPRIVTTAAFMFIPSELTIAHMASTFIPADIFTKLQRILGKDCILVSATDVHGIWIKREIAKGKHSYKSLINRYHKKYQELFEKLSINFDSYSITNDLALESLVKKSLLNLYNKNLLKEKYSNNYVCQNCLEYLPKRFRLKTEKVKSTGKLDINDEENLKEECSFCGCTDIQKQVSKNWVINLNVGIKEILNDIYKLKVPYIRKYLLSVIKEGIDDWDITRKNYLGFLLPKVINPNKDMYLWYESLIGYAVLSDCQKIPGTKFVHFLGKNIVYYHGIVWPFLLRKALNDNKTEFDISARGFLSIERTDKELIEIDSIVNILGVDYTRFYLAYKVRDSFNDFSFNLEEVKNIINNVLIKKVGSFLDRCRKIIYKSKIKFFLKIEINSKLVYLVENRIKVIEKYLNDFKLNSVLNEILELIHDCNNEISKNKYYCLSDKNSMAQLCYMISVTTCFLRIYVPEIISVYDIFNTPYLIFDNILNSKNEFTNTIKEETEQKWIKLT